MKVRAAGITPGREYFGLFTDKKNHEFTEPIFPKLNVHAVDSIEISHKEDAGKEIEQGRQIQV